MESGRARSRGRVHCRPFTGRLRAGASGWADVDGCGGRNGYTSKGTFAFGQIGRIFVRALPSLILLVIVIGGIVAGIFTATEASAVAVLYFLLLSLYYGEMTISELPSTILGAVSTTSIVLILIATSMSMSWIMAYENIPSDITNFLLSTSSNPIVIMIIINRILLFAGVFMDMTPAVLIFTPIFLPVASDIGIDPAHFGIIMILNLGIGLCTPPVGSVLFVGVGVAGDDHSKGHPTSVTSFPCHVGCLTDRNPGAEAQYLASGSFWLLRDAVKVTTSPL